MEAMSLKEKQVREKKQNSDQEILQKEIELTLKERLLLQEEKRYICVRVAFSFDF